MSQNLKTVKLGKGLIYYWLFFKLSYNVINSYGSRMVPGKKNVLSGGRHLIYLAVAT